MNNTPSIGMNVKINSRNNYSPALVQVIIICCILFATCLSAEYSADWRKERKELLAEAMSNANNQFNQLIKTQEEKIKARQDEIEKIIKNTVSRTEIQAELQNKYRLDMNVFDWTSPLTKSEDSAEKLLGQLKEDISDKAMQNNEFNYELRKRELEDANRLWKIGEQVTFSTNLGRKYSGILRKIDSRQVIVGTSYVNVRDLDKNAQVHLIKIEHDKRLKELVAKLSDTIDNEKADWIHEAYKKDAAKILLAHGFVPIQMLDNETTGNSQAINISMNNLYPSNWISFYDVIEGVYGFRTERLRKQLVNQGYGFNIISPKDEPKVKKALGIKCTKELMSEKEYIFIKAENQFPLCQETLNVDDLHGWMPKDLVTELESKELSLFEAKQAAEIEARRAEAARLEAEAARLEAEKARQREKEAKGPKGSLIIECYLFTKKNEKVIPACDVNLYRYNNELLQAFAEYVQFSHEKDMNEVQAELMAKNFVGTSEMYSEKVSDIIKNSFDLRLAAFKFYLEIKNAELRDSVFFRSGTGEMKGIPVGEHTLVAHASYGNAEIRWVRHITINKSENKISLNNDEGLFYIENNDEGLIYE